MKEVERPKRPRNYEVVIRKIKKIYENYGIDTSDMSEEELDRLYNEYKTKNKDLLKDLKESEKYRDLMQDDIIG